MCTKSNENLKATIRTRNKAKLCLKQKSFSTYSIKKEELQYNFLILKSNDCFIQVIDKNMTIC